MGFLVEFLKVWKGGCAALVAFLKSLSAYSRRPDYCEKLALRSHRPKQLQGAPERHRLAALLEVGDAANSVAHLWRPPKE